MNIFATSDNPYLCARWLDDKRLVKMILETAQLLCTAANFHGYSTPYKSTHVNHPCSVWARETQGNYEWLVDHFEFLCCEYYYRYGRYHECYKLMDIFDTVYLPDSYEYKLTPWPNCTEFKDISDVHKAYRKQMIAKWNRDKQAGRPPTWKVSSHKPEWYK